MSGTQRWCGVCKDWTEQTWIEASERWSCDVCKTITEDSLGCKISFVVKGTPQQKEQARTRVIYKDGKARAMPNVNAAITQLKVDSFSVMYTPKNTVEFQNFVKSVAIENAPPKLLTGALKVDYHFFLQRPQSLPAKVMHHTKKPDKDDLEKSVSDALEGVIYERDAQICDGHVTKEYGTPRVEIMIEELPVL